MKIYFAVQCHNFQRRLCWQLSSILEQEPFDADVKIEVASLSDNGTPSTGDVCYTFTGHGLNICNSIYTDRSRFARRGYVRNDQLAAAKAFDADWIFFGDCDNVYPPDFFCELVKKLKTINSTY